MANVIIKDEDRKAHEDYVMKSYGIDPSNKELREAAELTAARSREAVEYGRQMGGRKTW